MSLSSRRLQAQSVQPSKFYSLHSVVPRQVEPSRTRDETQVPCIGRQALIHCATREGQNILFAVKKTCLSTEDPVFLIFQVWGGGASHSLILDTSWLPGYLFTGHIHFDIITQLCWIFKILEIRKRYISKMQDKTATWIFFYLLKFWIMGWCRIKHSKTSKLTTALPRFWKSSSN